MSEFLQVKGGVCAANGFFADGLNCGLRPSDQPDLAFVRSEVPCDIAAVFTANRFKAAPLVHAINNVGKKSQGVIINAKNANAMTGVSGVKAVEEVLKNVPFENPLMSSTGVIGVDLPVEKIVAGIKRFDFNAKNPDAAARAIMTTDRWDKQMAIEVETANGKFTIGAMAKGAGMIAPQLATMLCFVTTDAKVDAKTLQTHLNEAVQDSFNAISVDGDMSTNDTVLLYANGLSGAYNKEAFQTALNRILHFLALEMVRDGEGATKLVAFDVQNARSKEEAIKCAKMLSNSLLVKTALFGEDPNWGRIAATIGASQIEADEQKLVIKIGDVVVYDKGSNCMTKEIEAKAAKVLKNESFKITCDLGVGSEGFVAYGCDLGHEYVSVNADYRS